MNADDVALAAARSMGPPVRSADTVVLSGTREARSVLLVRRANAPFRGLWALPGGKVEVGEDPKLAAIRELAEETGIRVSGSSVFGVGTYKDPTRDPRGVTSHAFATTLPDTPAPQAGSDASVVAWLSLGSFNLGELAFDHADILASALRIADGPDSPYLPALSAAAATASVRNASLLIGVNEKIGRQPGWDHEIWLREYDALKAESTERIKQRDGFINYNLVAIAGVVAFTLSNKDAIGAILAAGWVSFCFGWVYLANDEKISALSQYTRYKLGPSLGAEYLAWERGPKRVTNVKTLHKWVQLISDLLIFVVPVIGAPLIYLSQTPAPPPLAILGVAAEWVGAIALCGLFVLHSHVTTRFDVKPEAWDDL